MSAPFASQAERTTPAGMVVALRKVACCGRCGEGMPAGSPRMSVVHPLQTPRWKGDNRTTLLGSALCAVCFKSLAKWWGKG